MTNTLSIMDIKQQKGFAPGTIDIEDHRIHYEMREGSKNPERTMILCHGAASTHNTTNVLAGKLAEQRPTDRIILIDAPWHGKSTSEKPLEGQTVYNYAGALKRAVEALRANDTIQGKLSWFGWSMGGSIGMLLDLSDVAIDELILINSSPVWETLEAVATQVPPLLDPATSREVFKGVIVSDMATNTSAAEQEDILNHYDDLITPGAVIVNDIKALSTSHYDIRDYLHNIDAKTMIYSGSEDQLALVDMQKLMDKHIPDSVMHIAKDNHVSLMKDAGADDITNCFMEVFCATN